LGFSYLCEPLRPLRLCVIFSLVLVLSRAIPASSRPHCRAFSGVAQNCHPDRSAASFAASPKTVIPTGVPRLLRHAVEGSWHHSNRSSPQCSSLLHSFTLKLLHFFFSPLALYSPHRDEAPPHPPLRSPPHPHLLAPPHRSR